MIRSCIVSKLHWDQYYRVFEGITSSFLKVYKKKSRNRDFLKNQSEQEITKGTVSRMSTVSNLLETPQSLRIKILISNSNWTEWSTIQGVIVSITKFSIVIGPPRAYLSRNLRAISWVSNYRCPIGTFCNWIPTWFTRQLRSLEWFCSQCFVSFHTYGKRYGRVRSKEDF